MLSRLGLFVNLLQDLLDVGSLPLVVDINKLYAVGLVLSSHADSQTLIDLRVSDTRGHLHLHHLLFVNVVEGHIRFVIERLWLSVVEKHLFTCFVEIFLLGSGPAQLL